MEHVRKFMDKLNVTACKDFGNRIVIKTFYHQVRCFPLNINLPVCPSACPSVCRPASLSVFFYLSREKLKIVTEVVDNRKQIS